MKRSPMPPGSAPMCRAGYLRTQRKEVGAVVKIKRGMKTKQRAVTAEEKALWDRLAQLGCIACFRDGIYNAHVSIHHVDGRTKPDCHKKVLPLCSSHHQDDGSGAIAVHPWKARFEKRYGTQEELMRLCAYLMGDKTQACEPQPQELEEV